MPTPAPRSRCSLLFSAHLRSVPPLRRPVSVAVALQSTLGARWFHPPPEGRSGCETNSSLFRNRPPPPGSELVQKLNLAEQRPASDISPAPPHAPARDDPAD